MLMMLWPLAEGLAGQHDETWRKRAGEAQAKARAKPTLENYREALDVMWRADDWQAARQLAAEALQSHAAEPAITARAARALWRAGFLQEAERLAEGLPSSHTDPVCGYVRFDLALARADRATAEQALQALNPLKSKDAEAHYRYFNFHFLHGPQGELAERIRTALRISDAEHGYPESYVMESLQGVPEFIEKIGAEPVNQITRFGRAPMPPLQLANLPYCQVLINGRGPYRLVIDTGGSVMLSLDDEAAAEAGVRVLAEAKVRGVGGLDTSGQALIDELTLGDIACRRVMTRVFGLRKATMGLADGILGTGVFVHARMQMDFQNGTLILSPSGAGDAPGRPTEVRLIGDAKIITPVTLNGRDAAGLFDSGADVVAYAPSRLTALFPDHEIQHLSTEEFGVQIGVGAGAAPKISLNPGVDLVVAGRKFEKYSGLGLDVLDTMLGPILGVQCDALIGMAVFREMKHFTIDYPTARLWIEWRGDGE